MTLVSSFAEMLQQLSFVMTRPTISSFVTLIAGWIFAGRRTITSMIVAAGALRTKHHSAYHRIFAAARWSLDELGLAVFEHLILPWVGDGDILLALDDTLARKRGLKMFGVGMHHDPLLSTRVQSKFVAWVIGRAPAGFDPEGVQERSHGWPSALRLRLEESDAWHRGTRGNECSSIQIAPEGAKEAIEVQRAHQLLVTRRLRCERLRRSCRGGMTRARR